ncbi:MAG: RrF2 family transcriptional regulator [Thermodesulfobacteriota bacterium]
MKLSTKSRYGLRAIFDLAYHAGGLPTQIKEISRRQKVTPRYLEQIFQKLKQAGLVRSIRGPKGGYYLAREPEKISVADVIGAVEETVDPVLCGRPSRRNNKKKKCPLEKNCVAREIWREAGQILNQYFASISINRMCQMARELGVEKQLDHRFMYFI